MDLEFSPGLGQVALVECPGHPDVHRTGLVTSDVEGHMANGMIGLYRVSRR